MDLGGIAGVFAVLATSVPVGELLQMELQARGLATRGVHMWHTQSEVADQQQQEYQISHSSGDSLSSATAVEVAFNQLLINS